MRGIENVIKNKYRLRRVRYTRLKRKFSVNCVLYVFGLYFLTRMIRFYFRVKSIPHVTIHRRCLIV